MKKNPNFDFNHLTPAERAQLAQDLWDSIEPEEADWPLTKEERAELDRRLQVARRNPKGGSSWEEVRAHAMQVLDSLRAKIA